MPNETINVDGKDVEVREDTAKSYRGVMWFLGTVLMFAIVAAIMFFVFSAYSVSDGKINTPETKTGEPLN